MQFDFGSYGNFGRPTVSFQKIRVQVRDGAAADSGAELILSGSGRITVTSGGSLESNASTIVVVDPSATHIAREEFNRVTFTFTDVRTGDISRQDGVLDSVTVTALPAK